MLNEIREYEEYTLPDGEMKNVRRLKKRTIKKGQSSITGLRRPLTVIARYCIFEKFRDCDISRIVERTKNVLGAWLGDKKYVGKDDGKELECWLERYVRNMFADDKIDDLNKMIKKVERASYKKDTQMFDCKKEMFVNDINYYTYEMIIADAFEAGPLKRWYLVSSEREIPGIHKKTFSGNISKISKKTYDNDMDRVFKLTVAALLNSEGVGTTKKHIPIEWVNIGNWTVSQSEHDDFAKYYYKGEPLFEKINIGRNENKKDSKGMAVTIKMNKHWMENFGWHLVEEKDFKPEEHEGAFFSDDGCGKCLKKGTVY